MIHAIIITMLVIFALIAFLCVILCIAAGRYDRQEERRDEERRHQ